MHCGTCELSASPRTVKCSLILIGAVLVEIAQEVWSSLGHGTGDKQDIVRSYLFAPGAVERIHESLQLRPSTDIGIGIGIYFLLPRLLKLAKFIGGTQRAVPRAYPPSRRRATGNTQPMQVPTSAGQLDG
jgi:hypothetical protein